MSRIFPGLLSNITNKSITMKTALSKSKYTKYRQCSKALWLGKNKPEVATVDASVEARFAEGNVMVTLLCNFSVTL